MKKSSRSLALVVVLAVLAGGCSTNTQGDDPSPVFLTAGFTLLPAIKCVNDGTLLQFDSTTLNSRLKGSATAGSSGFLDTRVETYTIVWTRVDGGKTASPTETFGGNVLVPAGGQSSLQNYPFMSISALQEPPLNQLFPFNGGVDRETGKSRNPAGRHRDVVRAHGFRPAGHLGARGVQHDVYLLRGRRSNRNLPSPLSRRARCLETIARTLGG